MNDWGHTEREADRRQAEREADREARLMATESPPEYSLIEHYSAGRVRHKGAFPSIEAAIAAIPGTVIHWERDADGFDAADALASGGRLFSVERA